MAEHDTMRISKPVKPLEEGLQERLRVELGQCPDVAFAHLPEVLVPGRQSTPELVLFVWLEPEAMRSLRAALNAVSEVVAAVLPREQYLDVVILNSAPELLAAVEDAESLLVERNPDERHRALSAGREPSAEPPDGW